MTFRMNRVGTPNIHEDRAAREIDFSGTAISQVEITAGNPQAFQISQNLQQSSDCSRFTSDSAVEVLTNPSTGKIYGFMVVQALATDAYLSGDSEVLEYSMWAHASFASANRGFLAPVSTFIKQGATTNAEIVDCRVPMVIGPPSDTSLLEQTNYARGTAVFHSPNHDIPGTVTGDQYIPAVGFFFGCFQSVNLNDITGAISLRRPTADETYPEYRDRRR